MLGKRSVDCPDAADNVGVGRTVSDVAGTATDVQMSRSEPISARP
jgi:hypothetical protein